MGLPQQLHRQGPLPCWLLQLPGRMVRARMLAAFSLCRCTGFTSCSSGRSGFRTCTARRPQDGSPLADKVAYLHAFIMPVSRFSIHRDRMLVKPLWPCALGCKTLLWASTSLAPALCSELCPPTSFSQATRLPGPLCLPQVEHPV